jgi:ankyrin repeat protein
LAQIYLSSLDDKTTATAVREALKQFQKQTPESSEDEKINILDQAYTEAMERINGQKAGLRELAMKVLSWITLAKRQLTTTELQHALGIKGSELELDKDNLPQLEDMVSVCTGLVTVDEESNIIRLVHYTTQEYFERTQNRWFPKAATDITNTCITYLSFNAFETGSCATDEEFEARLGENVLFNYAARNWGLHALQALTESTPLVISFFKSNTKLSASIQAMLVSKRYSSDPDYSQRYSRQMVGVHVAAYFGLKEVMRNLIETDLDLNIKDSGGQAPLSHAADGGHEGIIQLLLARGADADSKDIDGQTPLFYAAAKGHEAVVQLLLDSGKVEADLKDKYSQTPLLFAAAGGHEGIVQLLLAKGAEADSKSTSETDEGRTPLSYAAAGGHESIVHLLLKRGADVDSKATGSYNAGRTPLSYAAENGQTAVVQLLLESGIVEADSKATNYYSVGRTPLSFAADGGHTAIVKLLLQTGKVDADWKDQNGRTLLSYVAADGHKDIIQVLLERGAYADSKAADGYYVGRTPLSLAAENGQAAIVQLLLESSKVEADSKATGMVSAGRTPLSFAAEGGHTAIVKLLLKTGKVDADSKDQNGQTPLLYAAASGHKAVFQLLNSIN